MCEIHGTEEDGGPRTMYFTHHGKPGLKPILARPLRKTIIISYKTEHKYSKKR